MHHIVYRLRVSVVLVSLMAAACGTTAPATSSGTNTSMYKMGLVYFAPEEGVDSVLRGLFDGLKEQDIVEGRNLEVRRAHANADIASIPMLIQNYDSQDVNVIVTLTTPVLTAAAGMAKRKPVVFAYVYDPIAAGAGKTFTDHLPFITGVGSFPPVDDTVKVIQQIVPGIKSVGTLYNSSEANSVKVIGVARDLFKQQGIELKEISVTGTSEVFQAAQVLTHRGIQALWVTGDNTALQSFDAIVKAAQDATLPLIINDPEFLKRGALVSVGLGWYEAGHSASMPLARVLRGESPKDIPFENVARKKLTLNSEAAKRLGITFPDDLVRQSVPE